MGERGAHRQERAGAAGRVRVPALRAVPPHDRARRTWRSASRFARSRRPHRRTRATSCSSWCSSPHFRERYPDQLSGGQRQRVALARALAPRPQVLLLDEPFGALDARVRQDLRRWLDELHRELGVTSLLVTHDQEEALELANQIVVMHEGRVEQVGLAGGDLQRAGDAVRRRVRRLGQRAARPRRRRPRAPRARPGARRRPPRGGRRGGRVRAAARRPCVDRRRRGDARRRSSGRRRSDGWPGCRCGCPAARCWSPTSRNEELTAPTRATRSGSTCGARRRSSPPHPRSEVEGKAAGP